MFIRLTQVHPNVICPSVLYIALRCTLQIPLRIHFSVMPLKARDNTNKHITLHTLVCRFLSSSPLILAADSTVVLQLNTIFCLPKLGKEVSLCSSGQEAGELGGKGHDAD